MPQYLDDFERQAINYPFFTKRIGQFNIIILPCVDKCWGYTIWNADNQCVAGSYLDEWSAYNACDAAVAELKRIAEL